MIYYLPFVCFIMLIVVSFYYQSSVISLAQQNYVVILTILKQIILHTSKWGENKLSIEKKIQITRLIKLGQWQTFIYDINSFTNSEEEFVNAARMAVNYFVDECQKKI